MLFLQKRAFSFSIPASSILFLFLLLTFQPVSSSQQPNKNEDFHTSKIDNSQKVSSSSFNSYFTCFDIWKKYQYRKKFSIKKKRKSGLECKSWTWLLVIMATDELQPIVWYHTPWVSPMGFNGVPYACWDTYYQIV